MSYQYFAYNNNKLIKHGNNAYQCIPVAPSGESSGQVDLAVWLGLTQQSSSGCLR